jgi:hypothetical protein
MNIFNYHAAIERRMRGDWRAIEQRSTNRRIASKFSSRLMIEAAGYTPSAFDLSRAFGQTEFPDKNDRRALVPGNGSLVIYHNGPFMPHALWALGRARVRDRTPRAIASSLMH